MTRAAALALALLLPSAALAAATDGPRAEALRLTVTSNDIILPSLVARSRPAPDLAVDQTPPVTAATAAPDIKVVEENSGVEDSLAVESGVIKMLKENPTSAPIIRVSQYTT